MASTIGIPDDDSMIVEKLPEEINEMKIKDEKVLDFIFSVLRVALYTSSFDPHLRFSPWSQILCFW